MKRFKKIYIEITNCCNLKCDFCIKNSRKIEFLEFEKFKVLLDRIKEYTDYLYLHVLGEPLLHPKFNEMVDYASKYFKINITTNGYLINNIKTNKIRQLNISLHSYDKKNNISLVQYLNNIFDKIDSLPNTYISLRMWVKNKYNSKMLDYIDKRYNVNVKGDSFKINEHVFINNFHEFIWPDLSNNYYKTNGTCYGLIDHIGILVDGTIVPCCLDSRGAINLGNIYNDDLCDILKNKRVSKMIEGFKGNKKIEELCKHCNFLSKN